MGMSAATACSRSRHGGDGDEGATTTDDRAGRDGRGPVPSAAMAANRRTSQAPTVRESGSTGGPAPVLKGTPKSRRLPAAVDSYSAVRSARPTITISPGRAAARPATAAAQAARSSEIRASSPDSMITEDVTGPGRPDPP